MSRSTADGLAVMFSDREDAFEVVSITIIQADPKYTGEPLPAAGRLLQYMRLAVYSVPRI
jgi:hypothetical protein